MLFITIIILIVAKALPVLNTQISSSQFSRLTSVSLIFAGLISLNSLYFESIGSGIGIYSGLFHITQISQIFEIFIYLIGGIILMGWYHASFVSPTNPLVLSHRRTPLAFSSAKVVGGRGLVQVPTMGLETDYSLIILFSILGSSLLITSFDLISIYLSIELQSFGVYVLSTLYKNSESSTSSGLKYFLLGGLSSCIILLGIGLIYSYTGMTNLESLYLLNTVSTPFDGAVQGLSIGLIFIFVGFLFKIAAAPLHNWSPDVYDGTPTIVTSWLTIVPKISILILLLELQIQLGSVDPIFNPAHIFDEGGWGGIKTFLISNTGYLLCYMPGFIFPLQSQLLSSSLTDVIPVIKTLLLISSVLSLIVGSLLGLAQIRIKRLLAYSTISHIGFLLLALAINTEQSIDSFLFYLIQYTLTNLNIFLIILAFTYIMPRAKAKLNILSPNPLLKPTVNNKAGLYDLLPLQACDERGSESGSYGGIGIIQCEGSVGSVPLSRTLVGAKDIRHISEFKGLFFSNPLLSVSLAISLFSMAGIPPLIGFFSKQFVLYSALQNGYYFISILAIIVSVISASYYLKIVKVLLDPSLGLEAENGSTYGSLPSLAYANPTESNKKTTLSFTPTLINHQRCDVGDGNVVFLKGSTTTTTMGGDENPQVSKVELSNIHSYIISTLTLFILLFFIKPSIILNSTKLLTLSLFSI